MAHDQGLRTPAQIDAGQYYVACATPHEDAVNQPFAAPVGINATEAIDDGRNPP
jgi:hypothetical protein